MEKENDMPGFLIADHGTRQFAIHTRQPRFVAEVFPRDGDPEGVSFRFHFHDPDLPAPTGDALAQVERATRAFYTSVLTFKWRHRQN